MANPDAGEQKYDNDKMKNPWHDKLLSGASRFIAFFYITLPAWLWKYSLKPLSWPASRWFISLERNNASEWVPFAMAWIQVFISVVDFAYGIAYIITPTAGKYKYYGILHITYLIIHTIVVVFFISVETGINEMAAQDGHGRTIFTFEQRELENYRVLSEIYGVLVVGSTIIGILQIIDLAKYGIFIPSMPSISYDVYFMFINVCIGLGCFIMCMTLLLNCTFRNRTRPILIQRRQDITKKG